MALHTVDFFTSSPVTDFEDHPQRIWQEMKFMNLILIKIDYFVLSLSMVEAKCETLVYFGVAHGVTDVDLWRLLSFCPIISREQRK